MEGKIQRAFPEYARGAGARYNGDEPLVEQAQEGFDDDGLD